MKPFDLEAAKRGDPIQAEDGRKLEFVAYVPGAHAGYRVVVLHPTSGGGAYSYPSQEAADTACIQLDHERVGGRAWPLEIEE